jgi:hypothetical protein
VLNASQEMRMWEALKWKAPQLAGLVLAVAAASLTGAGRAEAQPFFGFFGYRSYDVPETLSPELIYRQLQRTGYQPIGRIQRNGRVFLADVLDPRRRQLRLVIDRYDGSILERYVIAARAPVPLDERPLTRPLAPMADPNLPPPRLLPAPGAPTARTEPETAPRGARPRTVSRQPSQDAAPQRNRATATPAPSPEVAPQGDATEAARNEAPEAPAPAPARSSKAAAPKGPAPKGEGPGYANGVPINPLD